MNAVEALLVALLQGATELFPVSSLGHAVVVPAVLHWNLDQRSPAFLPFVVMLHAGTATALLAYFWRDWWRLIRGVLGLGDNRSVNDARLAFVLIIFATLPAVVLGFLLEKFVRNLFGAPMIAAGFLAINGLVLLFGERLRARAGGNGRPMREMTARDAIIIGLWQCLAFIPGISRSGTTMVGGLLRGINHEGSAHFSFLIATPVIVGATVLEVPKLLHASVAPGTFSLSLLAAVVAGITAWLSTWFLMHYFRRNEDWALNPFAYYCLAAGVLALGALAIF